MKAKGIMNAALAFSVAQMGHGDCILIGDAGCAFPEDAKVTCIDLALCEGVPTVLQVLHAVCGELCVEACYLPTEVGAAYEAQIAAGLQGVDGQPPIEKKPHAALKEQWLGGKQMRVFVRTGECTPFGYVMLVAGVPF